MLTDASRIGSESDLFSAFLGGLARGGADHVESVDGHPRQRGRSAPRRGVWDQRYPVDRDREAGTADGRSHPSPPHVRLFNRTTGEARGAVVGVTSPHADFHGSPRLALDDSLNRYVLQGRIVERDIQI